MGFLSNIITWDPEVMSKALMNTAMGISIVFVVLIMISLIIMLFNFIPKIQAAFSKKEKPADEVKTVQPETAPVAAKADNSNELIAVIAAAIAASTGASTDSFVVRSIKRRR